MRKREFYIRYKNGFEKVSGYVETITDKQNKKITVGFHNVPGLWWCATHLESGLLLSRHAKTRKECLEQVKDQKFIELLSSSIEREEIKEYIEQMQKFLKTGSID